MSELAKAGELGYGSQGLCPFCENRECLQFMLRHNTANLHALGVVEWCPIYKNEKDGFP